jgi:hypothetical protein
MTPANKIFYAFISAKLFAIAMVIFAAAAQKAPDPSLARVNHQYSTPPIAHAVQLSNTQMQTVVISTKRLTAQQKLIMDMEHTRTMQANTEFNKAMKKTA